MTRTAVFQSIRPIIRLSIPARRTISTTALRMAAGDAGAPRAGGAAQGDAFTKREQANEDFAIRQKEMEKLKGLKEKIEQHKKHLEELDKHVAETMAQGGKQSGGN
ncbi:MAG: hypothetical protein Q9174_006447 [Haloplaca sp. 1 TL-2023]